MKNSIQRPKGTADMLPSQAHQWHYIEGMARELAHSFGFEEIRTPSFEYTELFNRGVGDTTDVVQKEMYTFLDKGDRSITLKPEGTAGVVRAYLENGLISGGVPFKCFYITSVFRYDKPQAGRFREHHQFGIECIGGADHTCDVEVISLVYSLLRKLDVKSVVHINSIGCPSCRPNFNQALKEYFTAHSEELCPICIGRLQKNPMRIIDCKEHKCKALAKNAPSSVDYLCHQCEEHFTGVKTGLFDLGIEFQVDTGIVRGLDYYSKTVFEFIGSGLGAQSTICGGGRLDGLVEQLGGNPTPAIGFGCGLERLIMEATAMGHKFPLPLVPDLVLIGADPSGKAECSKLAFKLRNMDIRCETDLCGRSVKAQMKHADRLNGRFTLVLGQSELETGLVNIKNMSTGVSVAAEITVESIKKVVEDDRA